VGALPGADHHGCAANECELKARAIHRVETSSEDEKSRAGKNMAHELYYIFQEEDGTSIVEYESNALPPEKGQILNLTHITRDYGFVQVLKVEQLPGEDHVVVRVTVERITWQPEW
jgi:hypothetical protein